MKKSIFTLIFISGTIFQGIAQDSTTIKKIYDEALGKGKSYQWLRQLTKGVGARLSGSEGAAKAVAWGKKALEAEGFDRVFLQDVMVL